jgi:hypothetical protein
MPRLLFATACAALAAAAAASPVEDFRASALLVWGAGTTLPAPYAQPQDVTVVVRTWTRVGPFDMPLPAQTHTGPIDESPYAKAPGELGFVIDPRAINPIFPGEPFVVTGTVLPNDVVRWTWDTTQAGPFRIQGTFPNPPNPDIVVDLTLRNVRIFGQLNGHFTRRPLFHHSSMDAFSEVRFTHTRGDPGNWINVRPGSVSGTISGVTISRMEMDVRTIQHVGHVPADRAAVRGVVSREFYDGAAPGGATIRWWLYQPGTVNVADSGSLDVGPDGAYEILTSAPAGTYDFAVRGATWLRAARTSVVLGPVFTRHDFSLRNGDVNGDNLVDAQDFLVLAAAYDSALNGSAYVPGADLDKDGHVNLADFLTLAANYEEAGWNP